MLGSILGLEAEDQGREGLEEARRRIAEARENATDELDLGSLQLTSIPESIVELKQLRTLTLSNNSLTSFPELVFEITELRSLDLSLNDLPVIPDGISRLSRLEHLNVGRNALTALPATIGMLHEKLQRLEAFDNELAELPANIGDCARLQFLDLHGNHLEELPDSVGNLKNLATLNVASNAINALPEIISNLRKLHHLDASINNLSDMKSVCQLTHLHELYLLGNKILELPSCIGQLCELNRFSAASNRIRHIATSIGDIRGLQDLYLDGNEITELPESIGQLKSLGQLYLNHNRLTSVPSTLAQMTNLRVLRLDGNEITELPESIGQLKSLQQLYISHNRLTSVPSTLAQMTNLRVLELHGNDGLSLPAEVLRPDRPADILEYYFHARGEARPLNEAKLVLVGFGNVGKTCLVNRLLHDTFDASEQKTEGINISDWLVRLREGEDVRLHVWDFGGQEIMHATHRFFLTRRSLYLLVLSGREGKEDADAEYWLSLINSVAEDSSVIVVLNKIREHPFTVNQRGLQAKFANLRVAFVETDCEDRTGIEALRAIIWRETDSLPHLRDNFPATWFAIKDRLARMAENYLSFERYREICAEKGEIDGTKQEHLAYYLHNLGLALNYREDPRLRDNTVLNPHWVTEGIYRILNAESLAEKKGELRLAEIANILDTETYPPKRHAFLMELMRRFELCFRFPDEDDHYLVADLLDKQEPKETEAFEAEACLNFEYRYPALPEGLLPRFIVRTYVHSRGQPRWRTGVVLSFEGNRALVKADMLGKRVQIRVDGPATSRRRLLAIIRDNLEHIHSTYTFEPEEVVPVPGHPEVSVPYNKLLVLEREGIDTLTEVVTNKVMVLNIKNLLNGVDLEGTQRRARREVRRPALSLFYSYAHEDEELRDEMATHLTLFRRIGLIEQWHDRRIQAGETWNSKLDDNIERADVILLLVSAYFMESDYCFETEMTRALQRHKEGTARVIPIIVRDCTWHLAPFANLQALPTDGRAVATWGSDKYVRDSAWHNVADGIEVVLRELIREKTQISSTEGLAP